MLSGIRRSGAADVTGAVDVQVVHPVIGVDGAVRQIAVAGVDDIEELVVVTNGEGQRLAIIEGREAAEAAAEAYKLEAVSVH